MIRHAVFWGLCAVLVFMPLPFGSVEPWAEFVFEAATLVLFLVYMLGVIMSSRRRHEAGMAGNVVSSGRPRGYAGPGGRAAGGPEVEPEDRAEGPAYSIALPPALKVLLAVFVVIGAVQFLPMPPAVVEFLSPRAHEIYQGLARDGLGGWQAKTWWTLSLAPHASAGRFVLVLCYGLFAFLVTRCVRSRAKIEIFVLVMIASGLFQAFYGLAEHFSGTERILGFKKTAGVGAATGTFVNRNHFAGFLEMIFPLSLGYMLAKARYFMMERGMSLRRRILWFSQEGLQWTILLGLVAVFLGTGLVFSKSRSGVTIFLLTMVLAAAALSIWREFASPETWPERPENVEARSERKRIAHLQRKRFARIVRLVFAAVLAAALWLGVGPIVERFSKMDISREDRRIFIRNTLEMIGDFPLIGVGKGTYVHSYAMYEKIDDWHKLSYTHNDYLQTLAEYGVVGGACLIAAGLWLAGLLVARWRRRRDNFAKAVGLGALLGIVAILVHGLTDFNLQIPANAVYFVALCALGLNVMGKGGERSSLVSERREITGKRMKRRGLHPAVKSAPATIVALVMLAVVAKGFIGDGHLRGYRKLRTEVRSIESGFPGLEARLKKAWRLSRNPDHARELGRLYSEMVRVENAAGRPDRREEFCDLAVAAYTDALSGNPIDAFSHFETGMIYLLSNYPLMTYADKAKLYLLKALELKPADQFLHLHTLIVYLTLWDVLTVEEEDLTRGMYREMTAADPEFPAKLEEQWRKSFGETDRFRELIALFGFRN